jgi:ABC-type antimicrobial peptide transport system permease subunit
LRPVLVGVVLGAAAAFWAAGLLQGSLYGVTASDPLTFVAVALLLVTVSLIATLIPARRATKIDPVAALSA